MMTKFYFHFWQNGRLEEDTLGIDFPSVEAAYLSTFEAAREIWHELLRQREDPGSCCFEVRNRDRELLFELPFTEVLEVCKRNTDRSAPRSHHPLKSDCAATHNRAQYTKRELRVEMEKARAGLAESRRLIALLSRY